MNDYIDTREGWTETSSFTDAKLVEYDDNARVLRMWKRVEPVPPLPTEPYTVIRVWRAETSPDWQVWTRGDRYWSPLGDHACWNDAEMRSRSTRFEVLSEPRAVTAKAIRDEVRSRASHGTWKKTLTIVASEFGVES